MGSFSMLGPSIAPQMQKLGWHVIVNATPAFLYDPLVETVGHDLNRWNGTTVKDLNGGWDRWSS